MRVTGSRLGHEHCCVLIVCAWAYALVFACSPLVHWGQYGPEPYGTACCIDWISSNRDPIARSYTTALFICCYLLPCTIIIFSYTHILLTVRESRRAVEQHVSQARMGNIQTIIVKVGPTTRIHISFMHKLLQRDTYKYCMSNRAQRVTTVFQSQSQLTQWFKSLTD